MSYYFIDFLTKLLDKTPHKKGITLQKAIKKSHFTSTYSNMTTSEV